MLQIGGITPECASWPPIRSSAGQTKKGRGRRSSGRRTSFDFRSASFLFFPAVFINFPPNSSAKCVAADRNPRTPAKEHSGSGAFFKSHHFVRISKPRRRSDLAFVPRDLNLFNSEQHGRKSAARLLAGLETKRDTRLLVFSPPFCFNVRPPGARSGVPRGRAVSVRDSRHSSNSPPFEISAWMSSEMVELVESLLR